jgi:hypothetical protein
MRTKEQQKAHLAQLKAKWEPRGEAAGEATHKAIVTTSQAVQSVAYVTVVVSKAYVKNSFAKEQA